MNGKFICHKEPEKRNFPEIREKCKSRYVLFREKFTLLNIDQGYTDYRRRLFQIIYKQKIES